MGRSDLYPFVLAQWVIVKLALLLIWSLTPTLSN
jgi:hypothetical protein